jgi:DtxR family Mn-dependent transcriptional regulator
MASRAIENYLKQLLLEQEAAPGKIVAMGKLAAAMGVVPGTATTMVKALADSGLVDYAPRGGVSLTPAGRKLALHVLRRHRLVELFLVNVLGLDWSEVHAEAEELEHVVSDKVLDRIDALLGHPQVDPHGDPIPSAKGQMPLSRVATLAEAKVGADLIIVRVLDQSPEFLKFVRQAGLTPGTPLKLGGKSPMADSLEVRPKSKSPVTLSRAVAAKFLVEG